MSTRLEGDVYVTGSLNAASMSVPPGSVANSQVAAGAAIDADKIEGVHKAGTNFGIEADDPPTAKTRIVFVASGAATVRAFKCLLNDSGTSTDVDFDLLKNGVSILSAVVNIVHGTGDRTVVSGTLANAALVAGDVLTIDLAITASTGAQGPFAWVEVDEVPV